MEFSKNNFEALGSHNAVGRRDLLLGKKTLLEIIYVKRFTHVLYAMHFFDSCWDVVVYIVDTGVTDHEELKGRLIGGKK